MDSPPPSMDDLFPPFPDDLEFAEGGSSGASSDDFFSEFPDDLQLLQRYAEGGSSGADGGRSGGAARKRADGGRSSGAARKRAPASSSGAARKRAPAKKSGTATAAAPASSSGPAAAATESSSGPARKRAPGRWKRIPRELTPALMATKVTLKAIEVLGIMDWEERNQSFLQEADRLEAIDVNDCDCETEEEKIAFLAARDKEVALCRKIARTRPEDMVFRPIEFSDTKEEHPTAEEMETHFAQREVSHTEQVHHFSKLALADYNARNTTHKFELSKALTSNCFSELCGTMYAHVNFTAVPQKSAQNDDTDHAPMTKRLFFAELMFDPNLRADEDTEPMRVLHVSTIDDVPCYGGCHEIRRRINHTMRGDLDYERCHACHNILKHPKGDMFNGGHNSTRRPYYSAT